jgi:hypothetical protein
MYEVVVTKTQKASRSARPLSCVIHRRDVVMDSVLRANHVDDAATTASTEFNRTGSKREEGVVLTAAHVLTWVEVGATLTHDDFTGVDELSAEALHAKTLGI